MSCGQTPSVGALLRRIYFGALFPFNIVCSTTGFKNNAYLKLVLSKTYHLKANTKRERKSQSIHGSGSFLIKLIIVEPFLKRVL